MALANAIGTVGILADDDVVFVEDFETKISNGFSRFKGATVVKFRAETFEGIPFRKYPKVSLSRLNALNRLNTMSIEIALDINKVQQSGVLFDTRFGLGSIFPLGEEPMFINKLHDLGLQISFEPQTIVTHKTIKDSDLITLQENYRIRGAYLAEIFKNKFIIWLWVQLAYDLKSGKVKPWQVFSCIQYAFKGKNQLKITHEDNA